jgi:hypothetical protein
MPSAGLELAIPESTVPLQGQVHYKLLLNSTLLTTNTKVVWLQDLHDEYIEVTTIREASYALVLKRQNAYKVGYRPKNAPVCSVRIQYWPFPGPPLELLCGYEVTYTNLCVISSKTPQSTINDINLQNKVGEYILWELLITIKKLNWVFSSYLCWISSVS